MSSPAFRIVRTQHGHQYYPQSESGRPRMAAIPTTPTICFTDSPSGVIMLSAFYAYNSTAVDSVVRLYDEDDVEFYSDICTAYGGKAWIDPTDDWPIKGAVKWSSSQSGLVGYVIRNLGWDNLRN